MHQALARLRREFPLEQRLAGADAGTRRSYAAILNQWRHGAVPQAADFPPADVAMLQRLDAVVRGHDGLGCYPFSARPNGIRVALPRTEVAAMCALDALAIARLAGERTGIVAGCHVCQAPLRIRVENDGSLDHDQAGLARVVWLAHGSAASCSDGLCRALQFLCMTCPAPAGSDSYSLPQAAAIGNAFFGFQRILLQSGSGDAA